MSERENIQQVASRLVGLRDALELTPEQVAEVPGSFTGQYLKPLLEKDKLLQEKKQNK